ncbi:MAG: RsmD family RNA methyltransferase [Odoribacteraceae bacterium]|jgi:16S rRNA (guanine(966)-N(2))-methyltransferase RsmD|nr:RsmD family RNA methyltransferase [Odoribacteraceae bacterium]
MRVIGGTHRGRQIVPDKHFKARPTTDFAKENLFNVLHNAVEIEGARVLDLFAGTGSISYEFASRGAAKVVAIEANHHHFSFIKRTAKELGLGQITAFRTDVFIACGKLKGSLFEVVFADPPYDLGGWDRLPAAVFDNGLLAPGGILIIEHPGDVDFSAFPRFSSRRRYGSVNFSIFEEDLHAT